MKITENIREAIQKCLEKYGSVDNLAQASNVSRAAMYNICNSSTHIISEKNYKRLQPILKPFLEQQETLKKIDTADLTELDQVIISKLVSLNDSQKADILKQVIEMLKSDNDGK
jgi:response regulator of citrate/malate metabolism